ncbi:hypothetical protein CERSUDRAFT_92365 [Gelatoporia subvermispora B]|uniref:Uncharacterized protein n=1 Tax=Ceriporiopsis subvermispora (strain B) TaxID=914234 RepID=M2QS08_CERS8|nr:hypothetical protein CERSUDRAFT_92365 [Gelatoporia subvermispora B]
MVGVKAVSQPANEEAKASTNTKKKAVSMQAGAATQSSEDVSDKDKHPKARLEDLPFNVQDEWYWFGATYNKWAASCKNPFDITPENSRDAIKTIYYYNFGDRDTDGTGPPFTTKAPVVEYCRQHFNQYKNHMASTAVIALNAFFDHPNNASKAFTYLDGEAAVAGAFCSTLVMACFGVHFDKVDGAEDNIPLLCSEGTNLEPIGGLALAAASVERALEAYASGRVAFAEDEPDNTRRKSKKKKNSNSRPTVFCLGNDPQNSREDLYFSGNNYGDDVDDYADAIGEMDANQWKEVIELGMVHGSKYRRANLGSSESTGPATAPDSQPKQARKKIIIVSNLRM